MQREPTNRWVTFCALSLLFFVVSAGAFNSLGVVLPAMVRELGWNWAQAGLGYTVLGLACGLASVIPAVLIRRIGVRGTMVLGTVVLIAGFAAMAVTHTVWLYLAATLLIGIAFALVSTVPGTHVLTGLFERRSTVLGAYFTIGALGGVAGPLLYVAIQAWTHGWRGYWLMFVALAVLSGGFAILTSPGRGQEAPHEDAPPEQAGPLELIAGLGDWTVRRALATPQFYVIVGAYTMYLLINTTAHGFAVEHLTERGVDPRIAAGMLSLEALVGAVIGVVGGMAGEKVAPKTLMIVALIAVAAGMAGLAEARGYGLMLVYAVGVGLGWGLSFIASTMLLFSYFGKRPYLELYSIMCLLSTAAALGPALGGWARDLLGGFEQVFLACAVATLVMLVATLFMKRPVQAAAPAAPLRRQTS
ncbi:MAG TPA: MFS transporter [Caulobacteraceae bacterium]|nr:MFS transporter [Caulobacteraceae bacterium]